MHMCVVLGDLAIGAEISITEYIAADDPNNHRVRALDVCARDVPLPEGIRSRGRLECKRHVFCRGGLRVDDHCQLVLFDSHPEGPRSHRDELYSDVSSSHRPVICDFSE